MKNPSHSKGFSLIEVLFALFIFSFGLLGIAGLQLVAKQNNYDSQQRTTAALLASEIAEKIRVNTRGGDNYVANVEGVVPANIPATVSAADCGPGMTCDFNTLALYDLKEWYNAIQGASETNTAGNSVGGLVAPSACIRPIDQVGASGATRLGYTIAIAWRGKTPLSDPAADPCGNASGLYGANNVYRRLLVFNVTIQ